MRYKQPIVNRRPRAIAQLPGLGLCLLALGLVSLGTEGCGHKIGDSCQTSADCDPTSGLRTCDLSQPGGYCILEGCDARSCPSDSVCGRFFPEPPLLEVDSTMACDPAASDPTAAGCMADEVCLPEFTAATATGPADPNAPAGVCVRAALEKRACVQTCGSDGDCRGGYICRPLRGPGSCGTLALTLDPAATPKFCAPVVRPYDAGDVSSACSLKTSSP
jgi:hypothetical protein